LFERRCQISIICHRAEIRAKTVRYEGAKKNKNAENLVIYSDESVSGAIFAWPREPREPRSLNFRKFKDFKD
jgi:hypothetical protein